MSSGISLVFYLFSFIVSALLLYYGTKRNNKVIIGFSLLIPVLIGGLRFQVGTDYADYVSIFKQLAPLSLSEYLSLQSIDIEIGFYLLVKLSDMIAGNTVFLMLITSFLTVLFFYLGLKKFNIRHAALVYFLFLTISFPFSFNGIRQGLAISISFFAFSFIVEKAPKKYIFWILIAALFHKSVLFLLPFYLINKLIKSKGVDKLIILKAGFIAIVVSLFLPGIYQILQSLPLFEKYNMYQSIEVEGNNYLFYLKILILFVILLFYRRIITQNKIYAYFIVFFILDICLSTLGFVSPFIKRIALYFSLFSPLLLVAITDIFSDRLGKFVVSALLICYGLVYFYLAYYLMGQSDIFPYQFIFGVIS